MSRWNGLWNAGRSGRSLFVTGILAAATLGVWSVVPVSAQQDPAAGQQSPPQQPQPGFPCPGGNRGGGSLTLEGAMKLMDRAYKVIGRQIDDPSKDEATFVSLSQFQTGAAASKGLLPHSVTEKTGDEKTAAAASYRKMMLETLKIGIEIEDALVAGDRDAAKAAYAKLRDIEHEGHNVFRPE